MHNLDLFIMQTKILFSFLIYTKTVAQTKEV